MKRRDILRLGTSAAFGWGATSVLNACGRFATSSSSISSVPLSIEEIRGMESASVIGTDAYHFLKDVGQTFSGTTLRLITENSASAQAAWELVQEEFIPLTGIDVQWDRLPLDRVLGRIEQDIAREAGTYDIMSWDQAWIGRFLEVGVNPQELLENSDLRYPNYNFDDFFPSLVENVASYQGQLAAIPYDIPIFIMFYRPDILEELELSVPTTMADYLTTMQAITEAKAPQIYGTAGQWQAGHYSLHCNMTAWLWAYGGSIYHADGTPAINDDRAIAGIEYLLAQRQYAPPEAITWDWFGEAEAFRQGRTAILISWGEWFPWFEESSGSRVSGRVATAPCPQEITLRPARECGFGEVPGISHQGGSSLALSRYSKHLEAAWVFLQWLTSADIMTRATILNKTNSVRRSTYRDSRMRQGWGANPQFSRYFDVILDAIENRMGTEPHHPNWIDLGFDRFPVELGKLMTDQQSIRTTLNNMAEAAERATETL
ncbi:ABC transporter substrate-binding protein [Roseofilum casamattae]|uniref:Extracellular solute-binding protein n=1 Tax=Roseofilum casamattae BLCC-M143 TaxID=3022442 RepID=A0ABT7BX65_9CYAN|nr:extracellular solute-binding protein [Roseofilum casamattae]MDJ1182873.1 extracellular solute-binding protein [Roseofilum casamattae BLCC-M143]